MVYYLGNCAGKIIAQSKDIEKIYKKAISFIIEYHKTCIDDEYELIMNLENFRKEMQEFKDKKRTFASCLDICEIYCK